MRHDQHWLLCAVAFQVCHKTGTLGINGENLSRNAVRFEHLFDVGHGIRFEVRRTASVHLDERGGVPQRLFIDPGPINFSGVHGHCYKQEWDDSEGHYDAG